MSLPFWQILVLAVIQGICELLPVSSSAHVIAFQKLLGLDPGAPELTFLLVMLHTGTMGAAILYFRKRWWHRFRTARREFLYGIVIATGCTGVLGLALKETIEKLLEVLGGHQKGEIEHLFRNLPLISAALFSVGLVILYAAKKDESPHDGTGLPGSSSARSSISYADSFVIGLVQGVCLPFRGFSRSGATISAALLRGISREAAEEFSFALSVAVTPPVIVLQLYRLMKHAKTTGSQLPIHELLLPGTIGMVLAFFAGLGALRFLSAWLEAGKWRYFGYYCLFAGFMMAGLAALGY